MPSPELKVWIVTGCNSGFGFELARIAAQAGHTVIGTVRSLSKFPKELANVGVDPLELELTASFATVAKAIQSVASKHGRIDVLANSAGTAHVGSVEETTDDEIQRQFDANVFGVLRTIRGVLPVMRSQKSGIIINFSSIGGLVASEGGSVYCSSKFAIEALTEGLKDEVKPFGVRVHMVEPGYFRTKFAAAKDPLQNRIEAYPDYIGKFGAFDGKQPGNPEKGMQRLYELITLTGPAKSFENRLRLILGTDAYENSLAKVQSLAEDIEACKDIAHSTDY